MSIKRLNQTGDTIVEVLIAIAVLSLVLTASFILVQASTKSMQDSQEHGMAQTLASAQLERLKVITSDDLAALPPTGTFCIDTSNSVKTATADCLLDNDGNRYDPSTSSGYPYTVAITWDHSSPTTSIFTVSASWDSALGGGTSNVAMTYRLFGN